MIVTETFIADDGREFVVTRSDAGFYVRREDGALYIDAADAVTGTPHTYEETDILILPPSNEFNLDELEEETTDAEA